MRRRIREICRQVRPKIDDNCSVVISVSDRAVDVRYEDIRDDLIGVLARMGVLTE